MNYHSLTENNSYKFPRELLLADECNESFWFTVHLIYYQKKYPISIKNIKQIVQNIKIGERLKKVNDTYLEAFCSEIQKKYDCPSCDSSSENEPENFILIPKDFANPEAEGGPWFLFFKKIIGSLNGYNCRRRRIVLFKLFTQLMEYFTNNTSVTIHPQELLEKLNHPNNLNFWKLVLLPHLKQLQTWGFINVSNIEDSELISITNILDIFNFRRNTNKTFFPIPEGINISLKKDKEHSLNMVLAFRIAEQYYSYQEMNVEKLSEIANLLPQYSNKHLPKLYSQLFQLFPRKGPEFLLAEKTLKTGLKEGTSRVNKRCAFNHKYSQAYLWLNFNKLELEDENSYFRIKVELILTKTKKILQRTFTKLTLSAFPDQIMVPLPSESKSLEIKVECSGQVRQLIVKCWLAIGIP